MRRVVAGQPRDFLSGQVLHLAYTAKCSGETLSRGEGIRGNVLVHPTAKIGKGAVIGPDVVVGEGVVIAEGARVKGSCLLERAVVGASALVSGSIVGWDSSVGSHAHVIDCVLGEDVQIAAEVSVHDITVCPHKAINSNHFTHAVIL